MYVSLTATQVASVKTNPKALDMLASNAAMRALKLTGLSDLSGIEVRF